jgi:hypothetical protein
LREMREAKRRKWKGRQMEGRITEEGNGNRIERNEGGKKKGNKTEDRWKEE